MALETNIQSFELPCLNGVRIRLPQLQLVRSLMLGVVLISGLLMPLPSQAADDDLLRIAEALRAYRLGDPVKAAPVLEEHAARGNRRAAFGLATMYWRGAGVERDRARARELFRIAADHGSLYGALVMTSICGPNFESGANSSCSRQWLDRAIAVERKRYFRSRSVRDRLAKPDPPIPRTPLIGRWLAQHGEETESWEANYLLALLLETGYSPNIGVNARHSLRLMIRASEKQSAMAMTYIGELLATGHHLERSPKKAVEWYEKASKNEFAPAKARLGTMLITGPKVINKKLDRGLDILQQSAESGVALGSYFLGYAYMFGKGVEKRTELAIHWLRKADKQGFHAASALLGLLYYDGEGVNKNRVRAASYLRKGAENEVHRAQAVLADILASDLESKSDLAESLAWVNFAISGDREKLTSGTVSWAKEIRAKVNQEVSKDVQELAKKLISAREHGLSFVRTRTSWCVRIDGTLCAY